jgi:hypothetical protein
MDPTAMTRFRIGRIGSGGRKANTELVIAFLFYARPAQRCLLAINIGHNCKRQR